VREVGTRTVNAVLAGNKLSSRVYRPVVLVGCRSSSVRFNGVHAGGHYGSHSVTQSVPKARTVDSHGDAPVRSPPEL